MNYKKAFIIFLAALLLQGSFINIISVFGVTPNLILCLVVIFSFLYNDRYYGIVYGIVFGIMYDICFMQYTGTSALAFFGIAFVILFLSDILNRENLATILLITGAVTVVYNLFIWVMYFFFGSNMSILYMLAKLPIMVVLNVLLVFIMYQVFIRKVVRFRNDRFFKGRTSKYSGIGKF